MRCATSSIRRRGGGHDRLSRPPPRPVAADPARRVARSPSRCSICCRPIRCGRSPAAARRPRRSRTSATSSASTSPSSTSTGAISTSLAAAAISAAPTCRRSEVAELIASRLPATPAADGRRDLLRARDRPHHGPGRRGQARQRHRPGADGRLLRRRLGAAIRRRHAAALRLRRAARLVPDRRLRHLAPSRAAVADARHPRRRLVRAHDALLDDRRAAPGLHPHRARQGPRAPASSCSATRCPTPSCRSSP